MTLLIALLSTGGLAAIDYTIVPLVVSLSARLGLVQLPPSFSWIGSLEGLVLAAGLAALGLVVNRTDSVPLHRLQRGLGLTFMSACLAGVGLGGAERAGYEGYLISDASSFTDVVNTQSYSSNDVWALSGVALIATPLAALGWLTRSIASHLPIGGGKLKALHTAAAGVSVTGGAIFASLPVAVQMLLVIAAIGVMGWFLVAFLRKAARFWTLWWRTTDPSLKLAMASEVAVPGSGALMRRQYMRSSGRLLLGFVLGLGALVLSAIFLPLYLYYGVSGAVALAEDAAGQDDVGGPGSPGKSPDGFDPPVWRPLEPMPAPSSSVA